MCLEFIDFVGHFDLVLWKQSMWKDQNLHFYELGYTPEI